jgi:hypothetical protein
VCLNCFVCERERVYVTERKWGGRGREIEVFRCIEFEEIEKPIFNF